MRPLALGLLLTALAGCGRPAENDRFLPPEDKARRALEAALAAWRDGASPGAVPDTADPVVQLVDSQVKKGQRPRSFTVLGVAPGDGPRVFTVRLELANPEQELKTRYVVFGLDPLWVMRQEDYEMLAHWDHPMKKP
jgi:hypothetical protein